MTVGEMRRLLDKFPAKLELQVWLPGSRIRLSGMGFADPKDAGKVLVEGNVEPGSALLND